MHYKHLVYELWAWYELLTSWLFWSYSLQLLWHDQYSGRNLEPLTQVNSFPYHQDRRDGHSLEICCICRRNLNGKRIINGQRNSVIVTPSDFMGIEPTSHWGTDILYLNVAGQGMIVIDTLEVAVDLLEKQSAIFSGRSARFHAKYYIDLTLTFETANAYGQWVNGMGFDSTVFPCLPVP